VPLFRHELTLFLTYVLLLGATPIYLSKNFASASKKIAASKNNTRNTQPHHPNQKLIPVKLAAVSANLAAN
jgi:hypothetical protein